MERRRIGIREDLGHGMFIAEDNRRYIFAWDYNESGQEYVMVDEGEVDEVYEVLEIGYLSDESDDVEYIIVNAEARRYEDIDWTR